MARRLRGRPLVGLAIAIALALTLAACQDQQGSPDAIGHLPTGSAPLVA